MYMYVYVTYVKVLGSVFLHPIHRYTQLMTSFVAACQHQLHQGTFWLCWFRESPAPPLLWACMGIDPLSIRQIQIYSCPQGSLVRVVILTPHGTDLDCVNEYPPYAISYTSGGRTDFTNHTELTPINEYLFWKMDELWSTNSQAPASLTSQVSPTRFCGWVE